MRAAPTTKDYVWKVCKVGLAQTSCDSVIRQCFGMQSDPQNKGRIRRLFGAYSESDELSVHLIRAGILKLSQPRLHTNEAS